MAVPRVFVSSTFYDLRQVREDIDRFIRELGYEPVRNETGSIPYGKDAPPESYAYREIELCDIVVSIIGGRFGSESKEGMPYSISQKELKTALERGIQVFIFVDRNVLAEFATYQMNKDNKEVKYKFVDDKRVYEFIDEIYKLPRNNPLSPFDTSRDIIDFIKLQWAGLFQRFLQEQKRMSEATILEDMNSVAATLKQLVTYLTEEQHKGDVAIRDILLSNHPMFQQIKRLLNVQYRPFFTNLEEFESWLPARGYLKKNSGLLLGEAEYSYVNEKEKKVLTVNTDLFDENGRLKVFTPEDWDTDYVTVLELESVPEEKDDLPF